MNNHKKKLMRAKYPRSIRFIEHRLKRLNPKLFRLRKSRWTFRKKSLKKYLHIQRKFQYDDAIYEEDSQYYLQDDSYFYDPYRFLVDLSYGEEKEFERDLNFYTKPSSLYPADENAFFETKKEKLKEVKNNLVLLVNKLSKKPSKEKPLELVKSNNGTVIIRFLKDIKVSAKIREKEIIEEKPQTVVKPSKGKKKPVTQEELDFEAKRLFYEQQNKLEKRFNLK